MPKTEVLNRARNSGGIPKIGIAAGIDQGGGAVERQGAERHDERLQAAIGDEQAVHRTGRHAKEQGYRDRHHDRRSGRHQHRRHHRGDGRRRADRQIDAAGDDDQRHAQRHTGVDRGLLQDVEEIGLGQEVGAEDRKDDHDRQQAEQRSGIAQPDIEAEAPRGRCGCSGDAIGGGHGHGSGPRDRG